MLQQVHQRVLEMAVEPGSANPHELPQQPGGMKVGGAGRRTQGKGRWRGAQGRSQGPGRGASVAERASGEGERRLVSGRRGQEGTFSSVAQF